MMRARVNADAFAAAMKHSIAQRTGTLPVLQHALLRANDGRLSITTSDLETHCTATIAADIEQEGELCALDALLRGAPAVGGDVTFVADDAELKMRGAGRSVLRLPALAAVEFPAIDEEDWKPLDIGVTEFARGLATVAYAAGSDVRPFLNAVHLREGYIEATDGYRCALMPINYDGPELLIPRVRVDSIARLLGEEDVTLHICVGTDGKPRMLRVKTPGVEISVLLMREGYPLLDPFIERRGEPYFSAVVDRAAAMTAARGLMPFASVVAKSRMQAGLLTVEGRRVSLKTTDDCELDIGTDCETTGSGSRGMRLDFIVGALDVIDADQVRIIAQESPKAKEWASFLITAAGADEDDTPTHMVTELTP